IGSVDELNALIGVVLSSKYQVASIKRELIQIQNDLFLIGSLLAAPNTKYKIHDTKYFSERALEFEKQIDNMTRQLPRLMNFILPGGGEAGATLHLARTVCRRAERVLVSLSRNQRVRPSILIYINRLSDLLFTMARFANLKEKKKETIWKG
ncbi:MAG: cob(I)yrinic acid a,c-diamide adenosyltransferase, partial [Candidatus Levyibacteriota bacterium]